MTDREKLIELITDAMAPEDKLALYGAASRLADHLIANGVTVQKWIPVTERLPEEDGRYLCQIRSYVRPRWEYIDVLNYDGYGFKVDGIYTERVTYWRPLPPKEGNT